MRLRTGNFFRDQHGQSARHLEFVAPASSDPFQIPDLIEKAVPGLKVMHRGDGEVNGAVHTSRRPDNSLFVSVVLYDHECLDDTCAGGEGAINQRPAPALSDAQHRAIVDAIGEHPEHTLTGDTWRDAEVLQRLGFVHLEHEDCEGCEDFSPAPLRSQ